VTTPSQPQSLHLTNRSNLNCLAKFYSQLSAFIEALLRAHRDLQADSSLLSIPPEHSYHTPEGTGSLLSPQPGDEVQATQMWQAAAPAPAPGVPGMPPPPPPMPGMPPPPPPPPGMGGGPPPPPPMPGMPPPPPPPPGAMAPPPPPPPAAAEGSPAAAKPKKKAKSLAEIAEERMKKLQEKKAAAAASGDQP
jgi:hypothetical protein